MAMASSTTTLPFPVLVEVGGEILGTPDLYALNNTTCSAKGSKGSMDFRAIFSTPINDHGEIILALEKKVSSVNDRRKWKETVGFFHILTSYIQKLERGHEFPQNLKPLYRKCNPKAEPQFSAKTVTIETTGALWSSARPFFNTSRRKRTETPLQQAMQALTGPCAIRIIFPLTPGASRHPIEDRIDKMQASIEREAAPDGPLTAFVTKTPNAHHLNNGTITAINDLPELPFVAVKSRFASRDQQAVYLQYGLLHDFEYQRSRNEALSNLIGVRGVAVPQDLSKHPESGDHIKYLLLVKPDPISPGQMSLLPPVGTKLLIQPQVEVLRGRRMETDDDYNPEPDDEDDGNDPVSRHVDVALILNAADEPGDYERGINSLLQIIKPLAKEQVSIVFRTVIESTEGRAKFDTDIWVSAVRVDETSTLWDTSYHVWDVTMGLSGEAQGLNSAPVKFNFPEINLDAGVKACKQDIMSTTKDFDIRFKVDTATVDYRTQMRSLENLLNPYTGDGANRPSEVSRHAMEDSQLLSFRKYIPLGQRIPAFNKLSRTGLSSSSLQGRKTAVMVLATTLAASEPLRRPPYASTLRDGGESDQPAPNHAAKEITNSFAKTLVQAPTNRLCDELCARYSAMASTVLERGIKVVRLLNYRSQLARVSDKQAEVEQRIFQINASSEQQTDDERALRTLLDKSSDPESSKSDIKDLLKKVAGRILTNAHVVVGTTAALSYPWLSEYFRAEICVQEEAGLAREPETWSLLANQDPLVCLLVGDPNQFAPLVLSRNPVTAQEKSGKSPNPFANQLGTPLIQRLNTGGLIEKWVWVDQRSGGHTSYLVSELFYNGRLRNEKGVTRQFTPLQFAFQSPVRMRYNQDHRGAVLVLSLEGSVETRVMTSYFNQDHLDEGMDFIKTLLPTLRQKSEPHIGAIVTPYRAAASEWSKALVKSQIHDVDVFTPRTAQGVDWELLLLLLLYLTLCRV
ncbi:nonsense-mediated mRNA decay protein 1 [Colletotrichum plurivorum]|uniref:Nonsense-mediated mRNA decay protein 1 n=1 Tax=Colletotrichum plurivorum TaxID=2175906 RepID=A0A8H6K628_9PEZI|nr:nonsense-mediated mRNA decay protein 1 [Colletotrichum plurivorum]